MFLLLHFWAEKVLIVLTWTNVHAQIGSLRNCSIFHMKHENIKHTIRKFWIGCENSCMCRFTKSTIDNNLITFVVFLLTCFDISSIPFEQIFLVKWPIGHKTVLKRTHILCHKHEQSVCNQTKPNKTVIVLKCE